MGGKIMLRLFLCLAIASLSMPGSRAQETKELSPQTKDAFLHVLAHEIGHAMLREFDLPVLGSEEDIADDFATIYIYMTLPDRAEDIVSARALQHLADGVQPGMFSEYRSDVQRAGRSVCLLYGQDPDRFAGMAKRFGLEGKAEQNCRDFPTEVGRSWRRVIDDYRLPKGARVTEVKLVVEDSPIPKALASAQFVEDAYALLSAIDWHSQITLLIDQCDGSSSWSRNGRRIKICHAYIERFERQLAQ